MDFFYTAIKLEKIIYPLRNVNKVLYLCHFSTFSVLNAICADPDQEPGSVTPGSGFIFFHCPLFKWIAMDEILLIKMQFAQTLIRHPVR